MDDLFSLLALHEELMAELHGAIADAMGRPFDAMTTDQQAEVVHTASGLCELWDDGPGIRERGPGQNPILTIVAEQYAVVQRIHQSESDLFEALYGADVQAAPAAFIEAAHLHD